MKKHYERIFFFSIVLAVNWLAPATVLGTVDLFLSPSLQTRATGQIVEVTLSAQWNGTPGQQFSAIDSILSWNPAHLQFLNSDVSMAGYSWFISGFLNDPDGINTTFADGDGLFTVLAFPGMPATAPAAPATMIIAKFRFLALVGTPATPVQLLPTLGTFGRTRVLGPTAGSDVTGNTATSAVVTIVQPCSPFVGDIDGDTFITFADVAAAVDVYLGIDTTPAHITAADANCDGQANGLDIQPLTDYVLLWL